MVMVKYMSLDDSLKYIEKLLKDNEYPAINPITYLETAIKQDLIAPLFSFSGYASICDATKTRFSEVRQIMAIKGFFKDPYFSDYADKNYHCDFLDLTNDQYVIGSALVHDITFVDVLKFVIPYSNEFPAGGFNAVIDDHIELSQGDKVGLYEEQPRVDSELRIVNSDGDLARLDTVYVCRSSIFFIIDEIKALFISDNKEDIAPTKNELIQYLNFEQTVDVFKQLYSDFFEENNLMELIVENKLKPIVYFEGYAESLYKKDRSIYPEDFEDELTPYEQIMLGWQKNYIKGYFYPFDVASQLIGYYEGGNRFKVCSILDQQAIPNSELPNNGLNKTGHVYRQTPIYSNDVVQLFKYKDGFDSTNYPTFDKSDYRFSLKDIFEILKSYQPIEKTANDEISLQQALQLLEAKENTIKQLKTDLENIKNNQFIHDKDLAPNKEAKAANLIYTLLCEHDYKLTQGGKGKTNQVLQKASEKLGASLAENTIAYWLKKAYQIQLEQSQEK